MNTFQDMIVRTTALIVSAATPALGAPPQPAAERGFVPPEPRDAECGVRLTPEQAELAAYLQSIGVYDGAPPEFVYNVPIAVHAARLDNGTLGISGQTVDDALETANAFWRPAGIRFYQPGQINSIASTALFNIDNELELLQLWSTEVVQDAINVYFVNSLATFDGGSPRGIASFSYVPIQGVAVVNAFADSPTLAHELGHYFDLYHTHEDATGQECPDGSNCLTAGDYVCDTPADPRLDLTGSLDPNCNYIGGASACGQLYAPDTTNLMSYAVGCRDRFTYGQGVRAVNTLLNIRTNLVQAGGNPTVTWVDFNAAGGGDGSYHDPYNTLAAGIANVAPGGRIVFKPASTGETIVIAQPVLLDSFQGAARIGY